MGKSKVGDLETAREELRASYEAFIARGDLANAALTMIRIGDTQRMQGRWQPAIPFYQRALELAERADKAYSLGSDKGEM